MFIFSIAIQLLLLNVTLFPDVEKQHSELTNIADKHKYFFCYLSK